ncbi:Tetratricopeptide repeat protein 28 [Biomphalaria pfeifferi]|uniref:Tetratricopeptide repeat protein 28 n=1 Tax=Biomphalaria pfeifferi TaxID=112525 RepID=A0AAD8BEI0_BIOPF|nr:Tetratricopeptide repeat protein 28 [Biomphalaria pfeifferi]
MTKPVSAPIRRNNFILIAGAKRKKRSAPQYRISSLKSDCYLFSRLYVACQTRNGGLKDFFSYENLHDNNIVDAAVHKTLSNIHKTGVAQYNEFMQERLVNMTKPVSAPIRRNNFILIAGAKRKKRSAPQYRISSLKSDCYLFSRLYVACQTRNGGLTDFFSYENLHDNNIVDAAVHKTLSNIHKTGVAQYNEFMQERLVNMTKPVSAPIRRNNFILIAGAKRKKRSAFSIGFHL